MGEVVDVIQLPDYDAKSARLKDDLGSVVLEEGVLDQLNDLQLKFKLVEQNFILSLHIKRRIDQSKSLLLSLKKENVFPYW